MNHALIYATAIQNGCTPFWHDGIFGPAWHCGCDDLTHACDQQCSMIDEKSAKKTKKKNNTASPSIGLDLGLSIR